MVRRSGVILLLALAVAVASACAKRPASDGSAGTSGETFVAPPAEGSIYDLDLTMVDAEGRRVALTDLRGRPVVASMVYTSCTSVCPRVTEDMKAVEKLLPEEVRARVTFALFSLDPGRDTPAAMREFARSHALDEGRWRTFATSEDGVRDLSAVLGVKFKRESDGEIAHSALIVVIDPAGVIRHRQLGLGQDPAPLLAAVSAGL